MDRRIFFALAAIVGVCAAILLIPSHHSEDEDVSTLSQDADPEGGTAPRLRHSGPRKREPVRAADREPVAIDDLPPERAEARAANEARRATPYFQHVQEVGKRWLVLANTLGPEGDEEFAAEARAVSRELRKASQPSGTEEAQAAALEHEARVLATLRGMALEGEPAEVRDYLEQAFSAVTSGEAPPKSPGLAEPPEAPVDGQAPPPVEAPVAP